MCNIAYNIYVKDIEVCPIYAYLPFFLNLKAIPSHRICESQNQKIRKRERKKAWGIPAYPSAVHVSSDERETRICKEGSNVRGAGYSVIHLASVNMSINRTALRFQARAL